MEIKNNGIKRIAIQGGYGAFHEIAAMHYFESEKIEILPRNTFKDLFTKILSILSYYEMNLTKVQSLPIIGKDWEYQFYVDMEFKNHKLYRQSLDAIKPFTGDFGILGEYTKGKKILE
jgi:prephenate dehydratase